MDENGQPIKVAGPSIPVEILGLDGTPDAGDPFGPLKARSVLEKSPISVKRNNVQVRLRVSRRPSSIACSRR